ncbi:MFS transporter [Arthrobacter sp. zg-Y1171]|uniref:MFS transporter n=1 Tax=Arthrobacter sp. zg-Y1171 TaxID=2964610 RepID=UPI00210282D9|nr:MFS transporter [Arthrobacter sp. zg-Y1171]MCQ1994590.1 MFS transporter [Arthrobacter sp. zg-Y1171]UWX81330.1 MFS transporter [Arthrobacter sp. zg-Y1171]
MKDPSWVLLRTDRSFRRYWLGQGAASAGAQVTGIAVPLVTAIALDAGPAAVSLVAAAGTLPYLLFSLVAGHVLQGRDQRRSMVAADLAQCVLLAQIPLAWAGGWLSVPLLAAVTFLSGCCALIFGLSAFAFVPALVADRDLAPANRAVQATRTVTEISGPGLAGLLVSAVGAPGALIATMLGHLASAAGVASSRPRSRTVGAGSTAVVPDPGPEPGRSSKPAPSKEKRPTILTGLRILFADRHLRALTVHAATYNAAEQILMLNLILWAVQQQDVGVGAYGLALAGAGVGGLLGTLVALRLADKAGLGPAFAVSLVLSCAVPLLLPVWPVTGWTLAAVIAAVMLLRGIGEGNANIYSLTMRQQLIPRDELTRSAGAYTQVMYGSIPLGALLAGVVGETLGVRAGVLIGAVGLVLSAVPMLTPAFLRLRTIPVPAAA